MEVLRNTYCSQELTDEVIEYLEEHNPESLLKLLDGEQGVRYVEFSNAINCIADIIINDVSKVTSIPNDHLGLIDLLFEVSRRIRKAYDLAEVIPQGHPLTSGIDGVYLPLPIVEISEYAKKDGFTQEMVDKVLQESYMQKPDLWFALAEGSRSYIPIDALKIELNENLHGLSQKFFAIEITSLNADWYYKEAVARVWKLCGISNLEFKKLYEPHTMQKVDD